MEGGVSIHSKNAERWNAHTETVARRRAVLIEKRRKENELLKEQVEKLQRSLNMARSIELSKQITFMRDEYDRLMQEAGNKNSKLQELENNRRLLDEKLMSARRAMGGINVAQENTELIHKQIHILENRLDKVSPLARQ